MHIRKGKQIFRLEEVITEWVATEEQGEQVEQQPKSAKDVMFCCEIRRKLYELSSAFQERMSVCHNSQLSQSLHDKSVLKALLMIGTHNAPIYTTTKDKHPAVFLMNLSEITKV